jgi:hypothetical protein
MRHDTCGIPVTDTSTREATLREMIRLAARIKKRGHVGKESVSMRKHGIGYAVFAHSRKACGRSV